MTAAGLDTAAGRDPLLRGAYERCRQLNARHGRTYYLATQLLPRAKRPAVHALYGLARLSDDIVDMTPPGTGADQVAARLAGVAGALSAGLRAGHSQDPLLAAVVDTAVRYRIAPELFADFFASMRMDLTVRGYADRAALDVYVHGSAEVIGLQVLPVLGTVVPRDTAAPYAAALGKAFQLTNFLRDVNEDLGRGRVYLPADELAAFGVDRALLQRCRACRATDPRVAAALADQHARTREVYAFARPGIGMLDPASRPCVATAFTLYSRILDEIEGSGFAVFARRARVGRLRRVAVAGPALARALWARHPGLPGRGAVTAERGGERHGSLPVPAADGRLPGRHRAA